MHVFAKGSSQVFHRLRIDYTWKQVVPNILHVLGLQTKEFVSARHLDLKTALALHILRHGPLATIHFPTARRGEACDLHAISWAKGSALFEFFGFEFIGWRRHWRRLSEILGLQPHSINDGVAFPEDHLEATLFGHEMRDGAQTAIALPPGLRLEIRDLHDVTSDEAPSQQQVLGSQSQRLRPVRECHLHTAALQPHNMSLLSTERIVPHRDLHLIPRNKHRLFRFLFWESRLQHWPCQRWNRLRFV
mmetsp:Transcript_45655/g.121101  ORF Transcript_45655/g.121101 Transcript_45655/m.121101 type:complete len:247 (+) Transcript_45655:638-1378(+)